MNNLRRSLVIGIGALAVAALGPNAHAKYEGGAVTGGGKISGKVTFSGKVPKAKKMPVTKNPEVCGKHKMTETFMVGSGGALGNAVVFIKGIKKGKPLEKQTVHLNQKDCVYVPHVQATTKGSKVELQSRDPIMHNVHGKMRGGRMIFNVGMPGTDTVIKKKLRREGIAEITCDAGHTWMLSYIYIFEHPYFAVTGKDGKFELTDVPPGTYEVVVWHEKLGETKMKVTVGEGATATADFKLK